MKYSNSIEYNITTKLDSSGLTKMQNQIREIELSLQKMGNQQGGFFSGQVEQARKELQGLNKALTEAFNPSLGIIDISKFRAELAKGKVDSEGLASAFRLAGTDGQVAFNNLISQLGTFDAGMQRTSSAVDKMWTTFQNTFRWGIVSSFFSQFMNAIHSSVEYVKELDDSLTQIMLVTDYNRDSMNEFARSANEAAKAVSMTTTGMTNASLIFAQQGYDLNQSQELATLSAKVANASQQDTATTSDQITAYMNAYGLENSIDELTQAMDNWALIANISAADVGELAQASQRAASMANAVGVSGEQLASQIATIESVTREAPEQIGNGLKTLYARFSDIAAGGEDEDGFTLGKVTSELNRIGVQIFDEMGQIRDVGDIMEDLMVIWDDLDQTSKVAASQALAGKYQVNRFMALMDNSDMYEEYKGATGNAATGTLDQMNEEYAQSLQGREAKLQATLEGILSSIFNTDDIYPFVDAMQAFLDLVQKFVDAIGGAGPIITGVIASLGQLFSKNLANAFVDRKINADLAKIQAENYKNAPAAIARLGLSNPNPEDQNTQALLNFAQRGAELSPSMSDKGVESYNTLLRENVQLANQAAEAENQFEIAVEKVNAVLGVQLNSQDLLQQDETGLNTSPLVDILRNLENGNLDNNQKSWNAAINAVEEYQTALANLHKEIEKYQDNPSLTVNAEKIREVRTALEEAALTGAMSEDKVNSINLVLDTLNKTLEVSDTQTEEWADEIKDASGEIEKLQVGANNLDKVLTKLGNNGGIKDKSKLQGLASELEGAQSRKEATQGAVEGGQRQMSAFIKDTEKVDISKNIISSVTALGQLASAIMAVQNLGSIWKNEDLSAGEKVLQTVMDLSFILPQVKTAADALSKAFTGSNVDLFSGLNQAKEKLQEAQSQLTNIQTENGNRNFGQELIDAQNRLDQSISNSYNATKNLNQAKQEASKANDKWRQSEEKLANAQEKLIAAQEDSSRSARSVAAQKGVLTKAANAEQQALDENFAAHKKLATAQEEAALAAAEETAASKAVATAEAAEGVAAEADAKAQEELALAKKGVALATGQLLAMLVVPLAIGGIISVIDGLIQKEKEAQEAREAAMQAVAEETTNTVQQINQTRDSFNELWDEYKTTGKVSDELKSSLKEQCEMLGITDGELLITQGKYEELKAKIDETTQSIYANNAALLQANLDNKDQNPASQLTRPQQEKIGITTHKETTAIAGTGTDLGTSYTTEKEVYDQSAYQQVKAAQDYIEESQKRINELTKEKIQAAKEGDTEEIQKIDQELEILAQDVATYEDFVNANKDIISSQEQLRDNMLDMALADPESIFKNGSYDEIKSFIQDAGGEAVDSSNIDELVQKYSELAGNAEASAEALLKVRDQQIKNNEILTDEQSGIKYHAGEKGKFLINEFGKEQKWSDEDKAKISSMIDWTDPDVDQKVIELLERIQQGLNDGLSLDEALKIEDPEDVKAAIAEMKPRDSDLEEGPYKEMAEYLREFAGELEGIPEQVGQNSEMLQDFTEAILRYDDAIHDADENLSDWKDLLLNTADAAEDDAVYLEDLMEAFEGMRDMIGDLLDMDVSDLSQQFMQNSDVLDILDKAIYGVGEEADLAYDQLNYLAQLDMAGLIDWTDGIDDELAAWENALPSLEANMDSLSSTAAGLGDEASYAMGIVQKVLNGTVDGPNINLDNFITGLEQMVNSGEMSVEQAMAAIDGAGYSAEVVQGESEGTNEEGHINATPHLTEGVTLNNQITGTVSGGGGTGLSAFRSALGADLGGTQTVSWQGQVQGVEWTMEDAKQETSTTANATGVKYKANKGGGSGAGQIHFTNVKAKPSGSTKRNTSGNGNHSRPSSGGRGGGGGKSCFVAGTLISTSFGFKPIEQIQKKDIVLSYNKQLGLNEYSEVLQTMIHDTIEPIYTLYIKDEQLRVTGIHRFLVINKIIHGVPKWVHAADLKVGDWVLFADGTWHVIHKIEINIEHQIVYNFEVSGNHNYYVGRNQILAHNKGGGGKGGKGSGGGGKAKTIEPKEKKEHKKDYYEEVNTQLEKTEKILSKIEKEEDRLIGDKARANQNKQLSLLQKEIELNKEKQEIQQQELKDVDELMKKRAKEARELAIKNGITAIIPSPIYDEDGAIANYEEMSAAIDKIHNQFIDQYNAAAKAGNEELTKEIQKTLEKFDKYGEDLLKNAQRHDKLQSEIEETINTLEELEDSIEDIRIDAFKAHQEAQDDLKDLKEDAAELEAIFRDFDDDGFLTSWSLDDTPIDDMIKAMHELDDIYAVTQEDANKFYQDLIDKKEEALKNTTDKDEIAAIQSAIQYFQEQQANLGPDDLQNGLLGLANQDLDKLKGWIEGTNTEPNPFGKNEAALWEAYEDAYKRATDLFKDWRETVQDLRDSIIDTYDEQEDAINNNIDEYDRLLDHLERINDTYTLYYGEDSYDDILTIMDQQGATMQQQLNDLTTAFNYWEQRYQEAVENGDKKLIQEIREKMEDAEDAMYDKAEELAEHWVDRYKKAVDASIQKIDIKLWGGGPGQMDLEDQSTMWELQKDYMNTYRDDVEKAYEIDKLRSKYVDLLNDAQGMSLGTQNRIRKQMEDQLKLLENQNTVSEYDVKLANAKLEILQKQMALEDAQRNKNKMQLRRDTQGNYRYVYRADEGNVKQAQDELAESEFDAYEMTKEQTIANNDRAISLYQDYMNKMRDIANKYQDDEVARNAALLALKEEYGKLLGALGEDFQNTTDGMYEVLTWLVKNGTEDTTTAAKNMMDQFYENAHEVKENTGNDWRDLATQITKDVLPNIETAVNQGIADIKTEATDLSKNLVGDNGVLNKIKSSTKMLEQGMMDATDTTEEWAKATRDLFESFSPDNKKVQEAMTQLKQMEEQLSANQQATSALSTKYKQANSALQAKTAEAEHYKTALDFSTGAKKVQRGSIVKLKKGTFVHYDRYGGSQQDTEGHTGWKLPNDMWVKFGTPVSGVPLPYNFYATGESFKAFGPKVDESDKTGGVAPTNDRHHQNWWFDQKELQKNVLDAMDTGGYTGDWNEQTPLYKNGKIAMLHQKELVLNATDTQNILTAVSLMRDMITGSTNGLFNMNGLSNNISSSYNPVTEQRVEIQASFPNATDADDIRRALINLSDNAYQYSYRTR